jgi:hypothetical protein
MPYVRKRGFGAVPGQGGTQPTTPLPGLSAIYDPATGRYLGGSVLMDLYCNSWFGSSDSTCAIPTPAQIRASQAAELATTSSPPEVQAAALAAGDAAVAADMASNPTDYIAQCVASMYPQLASTIGPSLTANLFGIQPDCSQNFLSSWLAWGAIAFIAAVALGGRR